MYDGSTARSIPATRKITDASLLPTIRSARMECFLQCWRLRSVDRCKQGPVKDGNDGRTCTIDSCGEATQDAITCFETPMATVCPTVMHARW